MDTSRLDQLRIEREPETEPSGWGRVVAVLVVLAIVVAAGAWWWLNREGAVTVKTVAARTAAPNAASTVLNASGYVTARRQATVSSKFTGKVTEVLIEEGMTVEEGQVLARLDDSNLRAAFELADAQLASARSSLKETEALLTEARHNYDRTQNLVEKQLASQQELDRTRAAALALAAQLERRNADVTVAQRQVDVYAQQLEDSIIRAPFAGVIVAKNAQPGEMISPVSAGGGFTRTGIGTIVDMASLEIEIDVSEAYINRVAAGQPVVATLDAYPDWQIPCHVIAIIPTADRQRATVTVRVGFDETDERILPDMGVKVAFQETDREAAPATAGGVVVPAAAVRSDGGAQIVYVLNGERVERRAVVTGGEASGGVVITTGLAANERVVTEASAPLADGMEVEEGA